MQLGDTEETRQYSAFVLPFGHYEMCRVPFGWKNSPAVFQRAITHALGDLLHDRRIAVYIDDIICGAKTKDENAELTSMILSRLSAAGFVINLRKLKLHENKVTFLGRVIDGYTKTTKEESIDKVRRMEPPTNVHQLRVFCGLAGHFRQFIKDFAKIERPLNLLKRKEVPWEWTSECDDAFDQLKLLITSDPILQLPDWSLPFEVSCDASDLATGSILYQRDSTAPKNRSLRVIGYQSYTFKGAELNYSVTEKEALAVIKAIQYFRSYLEGKQFTVHSDHQALSFILSLKEPRGRLGRWQTFLMSFNIKINHKSGAEMKDADALSRFCVANVSPASSEDLTSNQKRYILRRYHDDPDSGGHDGAYATYQKIRDRFNWPGMYKYIKDYRDSCHECQFLKFKFRTKPDVLYIQHHSDVAFEVLHLDYAELEKKKEGNRKTKSFLVIVDQFSRLTLAYAIGQSAYSLNKCLETLPFLTSVKTVVCDNGPSFSSRSFKEWCDSHHISIKHSAPYHPEGNGLIERKIRDIKKYLSFYPNQLGGWKKTLDNAVRHLNRTYHSIIGCSPYFKAYGVSNPFPADDEFGVSPPPETPFTSDAIQRKREEMKKHYDSRHSSHLPKLKEGDEVLVSDHNTIKGPFTQIWRK